MHNIKLPLPLKQGGLGMRSWASLRHITHFSSWAEAGPRALLLMTRLNFALPDSVSRDIGDSVSAFSHRLKNPSSFWQFGTPVKRFKLQHILTNQLDDHEFTVGSSLSHDPSVNAQFIGSCSPHMCLPFNASAVPRSDMPLLLFAASPPGSFKMVQCRSATSSRESHRRWRCSVVWIRRALPLRAL
jgi:hypothetical protein